MSLSAPILMPLSSLYGVITRARLSLYRKGAFRSFKLQRPVISVGNITTGGTGKTPLVGWIAKRLAASGKRTCILTRGYGRRNPNSRVLVSDFDTVFASAADAGDEPYMLACQLEGIAAVISDSDRFSAAIEATNHLNPDCFLLDDGFQHLRLARDLDIVTIDATNPWGGGKLLPAGRLRENKAGLSRVDCVVVTRSDQAPDVTTLRSEIEQLTNNRSLFLSRMVPRGVHALHNSPNMSLPLKNVAAFCAVGNPQSFYSHLETTGCDVVLRRTFRDHHAYSQEDIDHLQIKAKQARAELLITTAKDAVKIAGLSFSLPCYVLDFQIEIENEDRFFEVICTAI
ncbi:MAG: tetraacyldisaccharide 4'-kinase [Pyrinomonadaceae bacterium]